MKLLLSFKINLCIKYSLAQVESMNIYQAMSKVRVGISVFLSTDSFSSVLLVRPEDHGDGDGDDFFQKFGKERKN